MKVEEAIRDVNLIKEILNKSKEDFSLIANLFIQLGIVKFVAEVIKLIGYTILNDSNRIGDSLWFGLRSIDWISFLILIVCFLCSFYKIRKVGNKVSADILAIWGCLIFGGTIVSKIVFNINSERLFLDYGSLAQVNDELEFFLIAIAFCILGVLLSDRKIVYGTLVMTFLYIVVLYCNANVVVGSIHGFEISQNADSIFTTIMMSVGLIILGIYLKRHCKGDNGGNQ